MGIEEYYKLLDSVYGCLFGGAIGDALGYPVEFLNYSQIIDEYGDEGIHEFDVRGSGQAQISDDTQMTLFTANGLLFGQKRARLRGISGSISSYVFLAYQQWYETQVDPDKKYNNGQFHPCWIHNVDILHNMRAPGNSCMSAIANSGGTGTVDNPVNNSKGCGGVMRVAPVGCFAAAGHLKDAEAAAVEGANVAALTHGHPLGYIPAAFLSCLIYNIIKGRQGLNAFSLFESVTETFGIIKTLYETNLYYREFETILNKAILLSKQNIQDVKAISEIGAGWVAEEALAIALYAVLKYEKDFNKAIICAVNHSGDSDSTGAIAGNILGAYCGLSKIDYDCTIINKLEAYEVIYELGQDLVTGCQISEYSEITDMKWLSKYVYCNYGL